MVNQVCNIHSCKGRFPLQEGWDGRMHFCNWKCVLHFSLNWSNLSFFHWKQTFISNGVCCKRIRKVLLCKGIQFWQEASSAPATSEAEVQILREILEGWNRHCPQITYKILHQARCLLSPPIYPMRHSAKQRTPQKKKKSMKQSAWYNLANLSRTSSIRMYVCVCKSQETHTAFRWLVQNKCKSPSPQKSDRRRFYQLKM